MKNVFLAAGFFAVASMAGAQNRKIPPQVWIAPPGVENGRSLRAMFENPDEWAKTRSVIDALFYTDLNFTKQFKDEELKAWFPKMRDWNLKLAMEVGAIKEWSPEGAKTFQKEKPMWERIERLGGKIYAIAMDEPLLCATTKLGKSDEFAVEETANYIEAVRRAYPDILIGDIETYPSMPLERHYWWIETLNKRLAERNVRGLDFYRLDVNWVVFSVRNEGNWQQVRKLEQYCRASNLPFSLIYWAAGYPAFKNRGWAGDDTWYSGIMQQGYDYGMVGGQPDQYVIESWVGAPSKAVPETGEFTFTRSVFDFVKKFVRSPPK